MDRRDFLKRLGGGSAVALSASYGVVRAQEASSERETGKMEYRTAPPSPESGEGEQRVSLLGYGCMRIPTVSDGRGGDRIDQQQWNALVDLALERGVNYFDTSPVYCKGRSEEATGIALSRHPRESYLLATKLSNFSPETHSREASLKMYHRSLDYLRTDYLDYMLLHSLSGEEDFRRRYLDNGVLDFLCEERRAGRIRHLGFSFHGPKADFDYLLSLHGRYHWDFVQIQMNYLDWNHAALASARRGANAVDASYLYGRLVEAGIPAIVMEPLLGGRLARLDEEVSGRLLARDPRRSAASWAFRFCGSFPGVLTILSGMTYREHLEDNLQTFCGFKSLTEADLAFLEELAGRILRLPTVPCTACQYCMPCPYGIDIPGIFAHYNKCVNADLAPRSNADPEYARQRRAFLIGYDRSVPRLRQADKCVGCGECMMHCPQGIDIPKELRSIDRYSEKLRKGE